VRTFQQRLHSRRRLARATDTPPQSARRTQWLPPSAGHPQRQCSVHRTQRVLELTRIQQIAYVLSLNTSPSCFDGSFKWGARC